MEDGGGSMHGCWSGRGSSSSRSTLDRASSKVTWVVMAAVSVCHTDGEEERTRENFRVLQNTSFGLTLFKLLLEGWMVKSHRGHAQKKKTSSQVSSSYTFKIWGSGPVRWLRWPALDLWDPHMVKGENRVPHVVLRPTHTHHGMNHHTTISYTQTIMK